MQRVWTADDWRQRGEGSPPVGYACPSRTQRRSRARAPRGARVAIPIVLWLVLLIWPTPQIGSWFATLAPPATSATLQSAERLAAQTLQRIPDGISSLTSGDQQHVYWQVGLAAGDEDRDATGMRATIVTTLPQRISPNTTNYFWVGSYLSDNSFVQIGYYVPAHDASEAGWFYCAFRANGAEGPCEYGALGSVGANGALHTYALESSAGSTLSVAQWHAELDGAVIGTFSWPVATSGGNSPMIYAESSGFTAHAATSELGPVDFRSAVEVRTAASTTYVPAAHLFVVFNAPNVCPPYGISLDGNGGVLLGSGLSCPDRGSRFT